MPDDSTGSADEVLDIKGLARYLKISERTAEEWDRAGLGPPRAQVPGRTRRWRKARVNAWLDGEGRDTAEAATR